jgi:hypothetical protein
MRIGLEEVYTEDEPLKSPIRDRQERNFAHKVPQKLTSSKLKE